LSLQVSLRYLVTYLLLTWLVSCFRRMARYVTLQLRHYWLFDVLCLSAPRCCICVYIVKQSCLSQRKVDRPGKKHRN